MDCIRQILADSQRPEQEKLGYIPPDIPIQHEDATLKLLGAMTDEQDMYTLYKERSNNGGADKMENIFETSRRIARREGRAEGRAEGLQEGRDEGARLALRNLMKSTGWSLEQARDALQIPQEDRAQYLQLAQ